MNENQTSSFNKKPAPLSIENDKFFMVILFFITVSQFSGWGYQFVKYMLAKIYGVEIDSTIFDTFIGLIAMTGSVLIFTACAKWWKKDFSAYPYFLFGTFAFITKNIFDMINDIILVGIRYDVVKLVHVEKLAGQIGKEFFELAFWVFILFYFKEKISEKNKEGRNLL